MLRPGIVFGPRSSWVSSFADALIEGTAHLVDRGRGICNSLYVDNLIEAIRGAMSAPGVEGEAFLLGDREQITWADLYRPIAAALGFDLESIRDAVSIAPEPTARGLLKRARRSPLAGRLSSVLPKGARRALKSATSSLEDPRVELSAWTSPPPPRPIATLEAELLARCRYKLPFDKATRLLGYEPPVSFDLACRRTVAWLEFAGYPVRDPSR